MALTQLLTVWVFSHGVWLQAHGTSASLGSFKAGHKNGQIKYVLYHNKSISTQILLAMWLTLMFSLWAASEVRERCMVTLFNPYQTTNLEHKSFRCLSC